VIILPVQTFFNLPEEKRQRIIEAAIDEFSRNSYKNASIARIIEDAGIPRGSFYQYFNDIKDLYKYVLELSSQKKIHYMKDVMEMLSELEAFHIIRELYAAGIRFAKEETKLAAIGNNFLKEDEELKREVYAESGGKSNKFFEDILLRGKAKGEIDPRIDIGTAAFMFTSMNIHLLDNLVDETKKGTLLDNLDSLLDFSEKMLYIMENGIKNKR
jgi:AcrR family transcriptional regulator